MHFTNAGVYSKPYRQGWYEFIFPTKLLTLIAAEKKAEEFDVVKTSTPKDERAMKQTQMGLFESQGL